MSHVLFFTVHNDIGYNYNSDTTMLLFEMKWFLKKELPHFDVDAAEELSKEKNFEVYCKFKLG